MRSGNINLHMQTEPRSGQNGDDSFKLNAWNSCDQNEYPGPACQSLYDLPNTFDDNEAIPLTLLKREASAYSQIVRNNESNTSKTSILNSYRHAPYRFSRYIPRAILNTLGPILLLAFHVFIVKFYLAVPAMNEIIRKRPVDSNIVFYAWWLINIFVLDWAKSAIAGLEAAALMRPSLAPRDAQQLMWHADRGWGSVTVWVRASIIGVGYTLRKVSGKKAVGWSGPSGLWFYLAFSSTLLYIAIPLSGLSMNQATALQESSRQIVVTGVNQSTFDDRAINSIAEQIGASWRQGRSTSPQDPTIFYAPDGTLDASATFYEDAIQDIYQKDLYNNDSMLGNRSVTIFSGPEISERSYGRAWGLLATVSCTPVHPYFGLELLHVTSITDWKYTGPIISANDPDIPPFGVAGVQALFSKAGNTLGVDYNYVLATDDDVEGVSLDYMIDGRNRFPKRNNMELVMWQGFGATGATNKPDQNFKDLPSHPMVVSSKDPSNTTFLGFAVKCTTESDVGYATLSAVTNTFSNFVREPSSPLRGHGMPTEQLAWQRGIMNMTALAYTAMSNLFIGTADSEVNCIASISTLCNGWASANAATGGVPFLDEVSKVFQPPTISPARMTLAMYKLLGQTAVTAMGTGPGNWTCCSSNGTSTDLGLFGLDRVNDFVPGVVSYQVVLALLSLWVLVTVGPQLYPPLLKRRWAEILDGFAMFRLGAEWKDAVHKMNGVEIYVDDDTNALKEIPGMIGDMNPPGAGVIGFVGLSRRVASTHRSKTYTYHAQET